MKSRNVHSQCFELDADPVDILKCIKEGHRVGLILRGVTGSGKSTLCKTFLDASNEKHTVISAYGSDCSHITKMVRNAIADDMALIVVDAENIERSVIKTLTGVLIHETYECYVMEPNTLWKYNAEECKKRSKRQEAVEEIERKIEIIRNNSIMWNHIFIGEIIISNFHDDDSSDDSVSMPSSIHSTSAPTVDSTSLTQFISLDHQEIIANLPTTKCVETNVSLECIIFELAGSESRKKNSGYRLVREDTVTAKEKNTDRTPPSRSTQTEDIVGFKDDQAIFKPQRKLLMGTDEEREFSLLKFITPEVDLLVLKHYHQILGLERVFGMFYGLDNIHVPNDLPEDGRDIRDDISYLEGYTVSNRNVDEELEIRRSERARLAFIEDLFVPDETGNDEEIARALQDEEGGFQQSQDDHALARLKRCFPTTEENTITFALDACITFESARNFLVNECGAVEATNSIPNSYSRKAAANCQVRSKPAKSEREQRNHFLNASSTRACQSIEDVQREALNLRTTIQNDRVSETWRTISAASEFHNSVMMERLARRREIVTKQVNDIDRKIRDAHQNPFFLDLHYMSVDGAVSLVKEALEAARYYLRYSNKSPRHLRVVTGCGNNSKEGAKIKPSVIAKLVAEKVTYQMINDGCILIKL